MTAPAAPAAPAVDAPPAPPAAPTPATPEAPAAPAAPAPEGAKPTPAAPSAPKIVSREEARKATAERIAKADGTKTEAPADTPAADPAATPGGEAPAAEPGKEAVAPAAEPAKTDTPAAEPAKETEAKWIEVPIPANHPLRDSGIDRIEVRTDQQARQLKALYNGTFTRRQQLEAVEGELRAAREQLVRYEATATARQKWESTPEFQQASQHYHQLRDQEADGQVPKGTAENYWKGFAAGLTDIAKTELDGRMSQLDAAAAEAFVKQFKTEAWSNTQALRGELRELPGFGKWFESALESFNAEMELGHFPSIKTADEAHLEFGKFFNAYLIRQPAVRELYSKLQDTGRQAQESASRQQEEQAARDKRVAEEAVEKYRLEEAKRRAEAPPHPLGKVAAHARPSPAARSSGDEPLPATTPAHDVREQARSRAGQRATQLGPR